MTKSWFAYRMAYALIINLSKILHEFGMNAKFCLLNYNDMKMTDFAQNTCSSITEVIFTSLPEIQEKQIIKFEKEVIVIMDLKYDHTA